MYIYKTPPDLSPNWLYNSTVPKMYESSSYTSLSTFTIINLFNFSHSYGCVVAFHCHFSPHFSLRTNNTEQFFISLLASLYHLSSNVYSNLLSTTLFCTATKLKKKTKNQQNSILSVGVQAGD